MYFIVLKIQDLHLSFQAILCDKRNLIFISLMNKFKMDSRLLLYQAINNHNFELVEYLFKEGIFFDDVLFNAVSINDEKMVKLILEYKYNI